MRTIPLTTRGLTLPAMVTLVLLTVLAALVAGASAVSAQGAVPCPDPTPSAVAATAVPIVVESTTDDYFVLYVRHDVDGTEVELPVLVKKGAAGTTTLAENVEALPKERYRVEKYLIADPADVDGDCIDDITELDSLGNMNPVNPVAAIELSDGAVAIPDWATFEALSFFQIYVKFVLIDVDTDRPGVYFANTITYPTHYSFLGAVGLEWGQDGLIRGSIFYDSELVASNGSPGAYRYVIHDDAPFSVVDLAHSLLAGSMPLLQDNLSYHIQNGDLRSSQQDLPLYEASRINLIFDQDIYYKDSFAGLNDGVGYGQLRLMDLEDLPQSRDVVIYRSLPNELPRVAGIITTVPQTPLSHVNLRAIQHGIPNAFIAGALGRTDIQDLIGKYVRYTVTENGWDLRAATREEVDAHYESSRPAMPQTPQRDLSVTGITPLSEIGFDDWDAFGVKAANVAVLGTLGFPEGTVPDGFAIPFYFYDEFMKHNDFYTRIETMLADPNFQDDYDTQESQLAELRDDIEDAETPARILTALAGMNTSFPDGINRRYRSSTNNEDLPGFNGAGLYDSKSQKPSEDEEDLAKSLKEVYASLWNFRAFTERDFHRIDHLEAAMGILVHPSYQDELVNGVAVSFDPTIGWEGSYYVNSQVGEDLVTNPDELSYPEEVLLSEFRAYILRTSNQVPRGRLLMTDAQLSQLRDHLTTIHDHFEGLYNPGPDEPFAMEIEFKITSGNVLAIKQARPWVFGPATATVTVNSPAAGAPAISGVAQVGNTLTAGTSAIMDADGGPGSFAYEWVRVDSDGTSNETVIGSNAETYTLVAGDEGKKVKVKVSFTDDAGNSESLTSDAYPSSGTIVPEIINAAPIFTEGATTTRAFNETLGDAAVATVSDIGNPVAATDSDNDTLSYSLAGTDAARFGIVSTSGQIQTKVGGEYDYEAKTSYAVTVRVVDGNGGSDTIAVTLNVTDQNEAPLAPNAPTVTATSGSTASLEVNWTAPTNTGRPGITSYDLQYQVQGTSSWTNDPQDVTGSSAVIRSLASGTSYEVQVRATNAEGGGAWSESGTGQTTTTNTPGITVSETVLTVGEGEGDPTGGSYTVVLDSQPTTDVTVTVAGHAGTEVAPNPTSLIFTASNWETPQTITVTAADTVTMNDTVTLTHSAASTDSNYSSITIADVTVTVNDDDTAAGICGRTPEVRDELLRLIENNEGAAVACTDVAAAQLAAITGPLKLSSQSIDELAAGDLAGLTALTALPETLNLDHNELTVLPDDVFDGLTSLKVLYLNDNKLTALPDDVFDGLTSLEFLYLGKNKQLTELPVGVFAGLTELKLLYLDNNGLTTLPDGVFDGLISLQVLRLQGNPVASFAPTADALPDDGTVPVAGGTVRLDGSGSGGSWGTNVTYRWALTTPASGVTVMFDNDRIAMPEATIPALATDTELTFTLTVTGRGHIGSGTGTGTGTAKVTATDSVIVSADATLGGLTVNDRTSDLTLAPAFALGTFVYTASVGNAVTTVTLTATVNHAGASVSAVTLDGTAIADSNFTDGITVSSLIEGGNGIVVTVTAENGATQTYTVTVTRTTTTNTPGITVSETVLTVGEGEGDPTGGSYTVVLDSQPTADVTVTVAGHAGTEVAPNPTSLIFTASNWETPQTITVTAADTVTMNDTVTLTHSAASTDSNYSSITIADVTVTVNDDDTAAGICGRTPEVRDALVAQIPGVSDCAAVTAAQLAAITGPLKLSSQSIDELAAGDLVGLTALKTLNLFNNDLTALPDDVFAGLAALKTLNLDHNELTVLPDDVFDGLTSLKVLYLNDNKLTALPDDVFDGLTSLEFLYLGKNKQLTELPVGVFAGLTELKLLYLDNNGLTTLPDGVFDGLISLQVLRLQGNPVGQPRGVLRAHRGCPAR